VGASLRDWIFDENDGFVHPSGQDPANSVLSKPFSDFGACPFTRARVGIQQQCPSAMQHAIAQMSLLTVAAKVRGAARVEVKIATAPSRARNLLTQLRGACFTVPPTVTQLSLMRNKINDWRCLNSE
jgi:hypothetical protein